MPKKDVRLAKWQETLRQEKLYQEALGLGLETIANSPRLHNGVTAAFKYFGLDPKSALHNRLLLGILADVCFQSRRSHKKNGMIIATCASRGSLKPLIANTKV